MAEAAVRVGLAAMLLAAACARPEVGTGAAPVSAAPILRVGVVPSANSVRVGGGGAMMLRGADGVGLIALPSRVEALVEAIPGGLRVRFSTEDVTASGTLMAMAAESGAPVRLNGRDYRGALRLESLTAGVMAVNLVGIEDYLLGVVGAEMGRRNEADLAGLRAQAVVSRTVAMKRLGRWRVRGYDLVATVADQAYAGIDFEFPSSSQAVADTRGMVLTYQGEPIDAFFHSTCGGRTAAGTEVFAAADRPYLRSVSDQSGSGEAWCAISPRFRWRESWTGESLTRTLRETLPLAGGTSTLAEEVRDLRVLGQTATGRVERFEIVGERGSLTVSGPVARAVLRTEDGSSLRSAQFVLQITRSGGRIVQVVAEGSGAGHGVGMCQWGALGRARAGQTTEEILSAYFPGTEIGRSY